MRHAFTFLVVLVAGCATAGRPAPPTVDWEARAAEARGLAAWRMTGRVAVVAGTEGGSAAVDWRQAGDAADVRLSGPLGAGGLHAVLDEGGLTLRDGNGETVGGAAAEAALAAQLGMPVPWGHLRYWLLGAPAPSDPYQALPPGGGEGAAFSQAGWVIGISRFEQTAGPALPSRLTATRDGARLKLAVTRWELAP